MTSAASDRHLLSLPNLAFIGVTVGLFIVAFFIVDSTTGLALAIGGTAAAGTATWWFLTRRQRGSAPFVGVAVRGIATAAVLGILAISITGAQVFASWNSIGRDDYSLESAQQSLSGEASGVGTDTTTSTHAANGSATTTVPVLSGAFETVLLIGGDELSGNGDVILYLVYPTNGVEPFMMSFPRDLYIDNPCTGGKTRINVLARGCSQKGINGGTLMSVMVTELTGIEVDHFATFDFDGFEEIIDALGGIELCFDNAVRDSQSGLDLPAGCTDASGAEALSWVRSRHTQEYRNGGWYRMPGAGDLLRNQHQQELILDLVQKLKNFDSPRQLSSTVRSVANAFTLSNTISLTDALGLAWSLRDIDLDTIQRLEIPVRLTRSPTDQSIVVAEQSPKDVIAEHYRGSLPNEDD